LNFLNSSILMGLAAVALPILIHLFTRAKAKPIPFSSLRFLKQLQNQKIRRVKVRQILLLILRTLIVLFLVLAFARPTCRSNSTMAGNHSSTSAVIVLDNSVSMAIENQGESLLASAKITAAEIVGLMQPGDELYFCTATDTTQPSDRRAFHDFQAYRRQLESADIDYSATNLSAGLAFAQNLLASAHNLNKEIYLLSDMQANGFRLDSLQRRDPRLRLFALPVRAKDPANLSLTGIKLRSSILQQGKPVEIEVALANTGGEPGRNKLVQVFLHGQRVAQSAVTVETGAVAQELFRFVIDRSGWIDGYAQLEDDGLMEDNQRFFSFYVPERISLGLVGDPSAGIELLQLALHSSADSSDYMRIFPAQPERISGLAIDSLQLLLFYDVPRLPDAAVEKISAWHSSGGGIIIILGRHADLKWYNDRLAPALHSPVVVEPIGGGGSFTLGRIDTSHPVFSGIFEGTEPNFARPQFSFALRVAPAADQHAILALSTGDPYFYEIRSESGAMLVFTSSFEADVSDMAYKTIFAPLLYRSVSYLASHGQNRGADLFVGDALRCRLPGYALRSQLEISGPDDLHDMVRPQIAASGAWIEYSATARPGIYRLMADGEQLMSWAVNIAPAEFDLTPADREKVEKSHYLKWVEETGRLTQVIREERVGREYWRELLIAAMVLLILEMMIYREKSQDAAKE
jgi:hypothetical protein